MKITEGWEFMSADFSIQAHGNADATGVVTLVRSKSDQEAWHKMPDIIKEAEDAPPLYIIGHGLTLEDVVKWANKAAAKAKPIV